MERLTVRNSMGVAVLRTPYRCESCGEEIYRLADQGNGEPIEKLAQYEDLRGQGKLPELSCAVGDTVYEVQELRKRIQPYTIIAVHISNFENMYGWELKDGKGVYSNVNGFSENAIGKTVFLTQKEAMEALERMVE